MTMNIKTLVIHATHLTERNRRIRQQLDRLGIDYDFILEGDKKDLTEDILDTYFTKGSVMHEANGAASCAMKHILACQYIIKNGLKGALILEDDIELHSDFKEKFEQSMEEYHKYHTDKPVIISYEDSTLQFVPHSQRKPGQMLYPADKGRYTGAFFINDKGAKAVIDTINKEKCHLPIDGYHIYLIGKGVLTALWCQPAIATQGSFTGLYSSAIKQRRHGFIRLRWYLKLYYKRFLYFLR